jgi:hypothetical protein
MRFKADIGERSTGLFRLPPASPATKGAIMLKIVAVTSALAIGLVTGAYAQNTGPAAQTDKAGMTNTNSDAVKKSGTTGMSSGSESGITDRGGANGSPDMAPKTTTGPAGSALKSASPPK